MKYILAFIITIITLRASAQTGKLSIAETDQLYASLSSGTGHTFDRNISLAILYYPGSEPCVRNEYAAAHLRSWYSELSRKMDRVAKTEMFVIHNVATRPGVKLPGRPVYFDKDDVLKKYFSEKAGCSNLFLIAPNGTFILITTEYAQDPVIKIFKKMIRDK